MVVVMTAGALMVWVAKGVVFVVNTIEILMIVVMSLGNVKEKFCFTYLFVAGKKDEDDS